MIIDQLPEISAVQETDEIPVERGTATYKATLQKLKDLVASLLTPADIGAAAVPLHLQATATSLPLTINNSAITATMRVIDCVFGTQKALSSDVTWTTSDGSIVLSGTMSGSTTVDLVLIETT